MQIPRLITTKESRKIYGSIIAKKDGSSSKKKKRKGKLGNTDHLVETRRWKIDYVQLTRRIIRVVLGTVKR